VQKFMNGEKDVSSIDIPTDTIKALGHQLRIAANNKLYLTITPRECRILGAELRKMEKELAEAREQLSENE